MTLRPIKPETLEAIKSALDTVGVDDARLYVGELTIAATRPVDVLWDLDYLSISLDLNYSSEEKYLHVFGASVEAYGYVLKLSSVQIKSILNPALLQEIQSQMDLIIYGKELTSKNNPNFLEDVIQNSVKDYIAFKKLTQ
jgi:hypothetical protein